jgi:hypothetical protein
MSAIEEKTINGISQKVNQILGDELKKLEISNIKDVIIYYRTITTENSKQTILEYEIWHPKKGAVIVFNEKEEEEFNNHINSHPKGELEKTTIRIPITISISDSKIEVI